MLGKVWAGAMLVAFAMIAAQVAFGDWDAPQRMVGALFDQAAASVTISLGLAGTLAFWMGLFALAEASGLAAGLGRLLTPLLRRLMPELPEGHAAFGPIALNIAANMLGLDNAATPAGLKAMQAMQQTNPTPDRLSDAQAMFLVLNAGSITLLPVSVLMYRAQAGSHDSAIVFLPLLLVSLGASLIGIAAALACQKRNLLREPLLLSVFAVLTISVVGLGLWAGHAPAETVRHASSLIGNGSLLAAVAGLLVVAWMRKVEILPVFVDGAREGIVLTLRILPYLLAMLAAVGALRAAGLMDALTAAIGWLAAQVGMDTAFVPALPTGILKTFSGSAARALMLDTFQAHGVDSFVGRLASLFQGASETTFYVLSVYAGSVGITRVRWALGCALVSDVASLVLAVALGYAFFA